MDVSSVEKLYPEAQYSPAEVAEFLKENEFRSAHLVLEVPEGLAEIRLVPNFDQEDGEKIKAILNHPCNEDEEIRSRAELRIDGATKKIEPSFTAERVKKITDGEDLAISSYTCFLREDESTLDDFGSLLQEIPFKDGKLLVNIPLEVAKRDYISRLSPKTQQKMRAFLAKEPGEDLERGVALTLVLKGDTKTAISPALTVGRFLKDKPTDSRHTATSYSSPFPLKK